MLTRWNDMGVAEWDRPFAALHQLRREMDRVFWEFEHGPEAGLSRTPWTGATWPKVSLRDVGAEVLLRAEVPGLTEKDIHITLEQGSLTLRGERKVDVPEGYSTHRQERPAVAFARSFTLPSRIDAEKVTASMKDGVLEVVLPKAAEAQPRQIQVRAS